MTGSAAGRLAPTGFFAALAAYTVARCALRFPYADDFDLAVGKWPPSAAWLWAQHNEHRMPLVKLLVDFCARHGDFRVGVWLSLALLTAACAWLVVRLGRDRLALCVLAPALLLNPESNAWRWDVELQFAACVALVAVVLTAALTARSTRDVVVLAIASLLLPLTGGNGVLFSGAAVLAALALARDATLPARARAVVAGGAVATLAVDAAWLYGWTRPPQHAAFIAHSPAELARFAAHLVVAPLGSLGERAPIAGALVVLALFGVIAATTSMARRSIAASVFAVTLVVLAAIAWGRAGHGWSDGTEAHYGLLIVPAYLAALAALRPSRLDAVAAALAVIACVAAVPTTTRQSRLRERALVADCGTLPADALAARYVTLLYDADTPAARARVAAYLSRLDCAALRR